MNSKQLQLSVLTLSTFACSMQAANPLRTAPIAARVAVRHVTQPVRIARVATSVPQTVQSRIACAAFASQNDRALQIVIKTPSLEECAQKLPLLLKERQQLISEFIKRPSDDSNRALNKSVKEIERYQEPIVAHWRATIEQLHKMKPMNDDERHKLAAQSNYLHRNIENLLEGEKVHAIEKSLREFQADDSRR